MGALYFFCLHHNSEPNLMNDCLICEKQASFDDCSACLHEAKNLKTTPDSSSFFLGSSVGQ